MTSQLPSAGIKPGAYAVSSVQGNTQLVASAPGQPVVLSATSAAEPWFIVPDDKPTMGPAARYIMISSKETFLAKVVDVDLISTAAERANALGLEILPDADGAAHKLIADGLVLARVSPGHTFDVDGKVELRSPDVADHGDHAAQLWKLTPIQGDGFTQFDPLL